MQKMAVILETENLLLRSTEVEFAESLLDYYSRNKAFLENVEPKRDRSFFIYQNQYDQLQKELIEESDKRSFHFYISDRGDSKTIIGCIGISNIVWGCFFILLFGIQIGQ